ncbi:MAG: branched-chain amino acid ABC transporter permease [Candidatus Tectomicrobia bacterium]|jgi:branched-chain amino acid transport system permease protein|nr:branched-chain amino acid ABC transporter permease [Candidatus Tectomicrobia bacterium]
MTMPLIQVLIGGLLQGGMYALGAFGLSLVFGVLGILNVAHGDFLMLGGLLCYGAYVALGLDPVVALTIVIPVFFGVGCLFERILIQPLLSKSHHELLMGSILVTLGAALAIEDLVPFVWTQSFSGIPYTLPSLVIGDVVIPTLRLAILLGIVTLTLVLHVFLRRTSVGIALRAMTENRQGAMLVGINLPRLSMLAFGIGTALVATAGVAHVTLYSITPTMGIPLTLKYLTIVVLGGLGSLLGSVFGGMVLGLSEALTSLYIGPEWAPTVAFLVLIVVLVTRPQGLFGMRQP